MNLICWFLGHKVDGKLVPRSRLNSEGQMATAWQYYCKRCSTKEEFPSSANLYHRLFSWSRWFIKWKNGKFFREGNKQPPTFVDKLRTRFQIYPD